MRKGILAAGNFIVDHVKIIDVFPTQDSLCNILSQSTSNGGGAYNVLKNTSKLDQDIPLEAIGLIGNDANGHFIIDDCVKHNIDTRYLKKTISKSTSYTDVMSAKSDGRRTFFHNRGANSILDIDTANLESSNAKIFYLGYLMLLDELDKIQNNGKTKASEAFEKAQQLGFITVSDLVSENSGKFRDTVASSLPFIDYLFINEYEAAKITGINTYIDTEIDRLACENACQDLLNMGVNQWVILHFPKGVIAISKKGEKILQPSLKIPKEQIKGATGAGDAFATGCIVGIHEGWDIKKSLALGVSAAASCLFESTCSDGILSIEKCLLLIDKYGYQ